MSSDEARGEPGRTGDRLHKREARRRALEARDRLAPARRDRLAEEVCAQAMRLPELAAARTVMLFAAFRSELDTAPLARWVLGEDKILCLPRILGPRRMAAFRVTDLVADLAPGRWGIPEPREEMPEVSPRTIDLVFVPGSAFDESGGRCGYGGGFYDNFLPLTRPGTPWVALAFETQLVPPIDCEPHDLSVTAIVTERRVIRPG